MKVTFAQVETIMKTLPIGYYAVKRVPARLEQNTEAGTSYFSFTDNSIVIEYNLIAERLEKYPEDADIEEAVRSMLYHEVSHAILTPHDEADRRMYNETTARVFNIFEDERIETLLRDYYMNVDFKKQIQQIAKPHQDDSNPMSVFFDLVRFGIGSKKYLDEVQRIIYKYKKITCQTRGYVVYEYIDEIMNLYREIESDMRTPDSDMSGDGDGDSSASSEDETNGEGMEKTDKKTVIMSNSELRDMIGHAMDNTEIVMEKDNAEKLEAGMTEQEKHYTEELTHFEKSITRIIDNFHRKNNGGNGINAYSGVFNPRALLREDYRYFERSFSTHSNNKFGTCHLNCFIDCSGSFYYDTPIVNKIIGILTDIEKHHPNFSISVIHINTNWHEAQNTLDRQFKAGGGNDIPEDIKERFNKLQKRNTYVHNLVLFDGDAMSDCYASRSEKIRRFSAFDTTTTTLITDEENERYCADFHNARVTVTKKYVDELIKAILLSLEKAFS